MRRVAVISGLSCAALFLTGCTYGEDPGLTSPAPSASAEALAVQDQPGPTLASIPPGVIGTGTLQSDNGTTGEVSFELDGDGLALTISNLVTPTVREVEAMVSVGPIPAEETCFDAGFRFGFGMFADGDGTGTIGDLSLVRDDPSGIDQVILVATPVIGENSSGCLAAIVARADIEWTFAPLRSYIDPIDSGETGGANGTVELIDGKPARYSVAPNDLIADVAARFGITVDDIFYLNLSRQPLTTQSMLRVGEQLNLLPAGR